LQSRLDEQRRRREQQKANSKANKERRAAEAKDKKKKKAKEAKEKKKGGLVRFDVALIVACKTSWVVCLFTYCFCSLVSSETTRRRKKMTSRSRTPIIL